MGLGGKTNLFDTTCLAYSIFSHIIPIFTSEWSEVGRVQVLVALIKRAGSDFLMQNWSQI